MKEKRLLQDVVRKSNDGISKNTSLLRGDVAQRERIQATPPILDDARSNMRSPHMRPPDRKAPIAVIPSSPRSGKQIWVMLSAVFLLLSGALICLVAFVFNDTTVTVYAKRANAVFVDGTFLASSEPREGEIAILPITVERVASQVLEANNSAYVEEFASGEIQIFNSFDANPQRLIRETRFEDERGNIYRIRDAVEVPGVTKNSAGEIVPGVIRAVIYASEPGEAYNTERATFTIPGFTGTPRFEKFLARNTTPIQGGFKGTRRTVKPEEETRTRSELRSTLESEIKTAAVALANVPAGYRVFDTGIFVDFSSMETLPEGESQVRIQERATASAIGFDEKKLARILAGSVVAGYDNQPIKIESFDTLSVSVVKNEEGGKPWDGKTYRVTVKGTANFVWEYDSEALARDLVGKSNAPSTLQTILSGYPGIERADAVIRPFWKKEFPDRREEIRIIQSSLDE